MRTAGYIFTRRAGEPRGCCDGGDSPDDCCNPVTRFSVGDFSPTQTMIGVGIIAYAAYALFFSKKKR